MGRIKSNKRCRAVYFSFFSLSLFFYSPEYINCAPEFPLFVRDTVFHIGAYFHATLRDRSHTLNPVKLKAHRQHVKWSFGMNWDRKCIHLILVSLCLQSLLISSCIYIKSSSTRMEATINVNISCNMLSCHEMSLTLTHWALNFCKGNNPYTYKIVAVLCVSGILSKNWL